MSFLLDTNACIALLNQDKALEKRMRQHTARDFKLCSIVKAELLFGALASKRSADNLRRLDFLFARFESFDFTDECAVHCGEIRAALQRNATPIDPNDLLIASVALANGVAVFTRNEREFRRVPKLRVEIY